MSKELKKVLVLIAVASMMFATMPMLQISKAAPADSMWVQFEPEGVSAKTFKTDTTSVGDKFNVTIWMNITSKDQYSWQFKLYYDTTQLLALRAGYTAGGTSKWATHAQGGTATTPVPLVIESNYVFWGEALQGEEYVPAGTCDSLAWVEFQIIAAPPMGGQLTSLLDINNEDTYMLDTSLGTIPTTKYSASYAYQWVAPPKPRLAVDPSYREYGPYPPSAVGTEFDENIIIQGLSAAWFLVNVSTHLAYNPTLLGVVSVTFGSAWTYTEYTVTDGDIYLFANATTPPSGDVLLATVRFNITSQGTAPPRTPGEYDESPLDLNNYHLYAETIEITTNPEIDGKVRIYCLITLPLAHLEVSSVTMGPEPVLGQEFNVTVSIKNLDSHWYMIGLQFRLSYPADLIEPVAVYEGPFFKSFAVPPSLGTWFQSYFETDGTYGPHVLVGVLLYPDENGTWHEPWPEGEGVIATIKFKVIYQCYPETNTGPLNIIEQLAVGLDGPVTQNIVNVPLDSAVNGLYTVTTSLPGRMIDLYGGAVNKGYGTSHGYNYNGIGVIWPAGYGGQGVNNPMDLVIPQSEVWLFANVTYNYWPVENKIVTFEVKDNQGNTLAVLYGITDSNGVAYATFRMPGGDNPESLFGVWTVIATVSVGDQVITDTMTFHFDYLVHIWKVTTDKYQYNHYELVTVNVEFGTHAMQEYPILITVVIQDELGVVIGKQTSESTVGGAVYSTYRNYQMSRQIQIPKWAYAGIATVHVNAFDKWPVLGGTAWCPEYAPAPTIAIQPY